MIRLTLSQSPVLPCDKLKIAQASSTPNDVQRYVNACNNKHFYSLSLIPTYLPKSQIKQLLDQDYQRHQLAKMFHSTTPQDYFNLIKQGNTIWFLVDDNNVDHGFAVVKKISDSTVLIGDFSVYTHLQGHGSHFYKLLEHKFREMGFTSVKLSPLGDGAAAFWKKMEFTADFLNAQNYYKALK